MNDTFINTDIELIDNPEENEAFASISLNQGYQWAKIVVTDDMPNANKHRIPLEEFENLIKTGIFAPIKMAENQISPGHAEAMGKPIGAITQLTQSGNKLIALAALWKRERPEEIAMLKEMYVKGTPPNVSWELSYEDSIDEDNQVKAFKNTSLNGLCVVSNPAYVGRTPFLAMASEEHKEEHVEELETVKQEVSDLKNKVAELESLLSSKETEIASLREFKQNIEAEKIKVEKLINLREKFTKAGLEKPEEFWAEKSDLLLNMDEASLDFMIQELVAFSSAEKQESASNKSTKIPNIKSESQSTKLTPAQLGKALRESKTKQ